MKYIFTLLFVFANVLTLSAQWSNTSNLFYDSLHMPVSVVTNEQLHSIVVKSYPDSGYFVIWEDDRNSASTKKDIYAQKYDKAGNRLWALNGLPVVNGQNDERFTWSSNEDYRNRKYAATDNANGFYIAYTDDSIDGGDWERVCIQHIKPDGSQVFQGPGFIAAQTQADQLYNFSDPQLINDEAGNIYVSYIKNFGNDYIYIDGYKDLGTSLSLMGGGIVNQNAIQKQMQQFCAGSIRIFLVYPTTRVRDYNIWSDMQGGCSVVMSMNGNDGTQGNILAYNRVWKAKKDAVATAASLFPTGDPTTVVTTYKKDDLDILYKLKILNLAGSCTDASGHYFWTNETVLSNGYMTLDQGAYEYAFPKGAIVKTAGNIYVELMASLKRTQDTVTNLVNLPTLQGYGNPAEVLDSIPYQASSNANPEVGFNVIMPADMNKLTAFNDTLLAPGGNASDFSLAAGANQFYATALMLEQGQSSRSVRLQHLGVDPDGINSFGIHSSTGSNKGELIGKEINAPVAGSALKFDVPLVTANATGNALFYILETQGRIRVSPIGLGAELTWGAMGKPIGSSVFNGFIYTPTNPVAIVDANGTGLISWEDDRLIAANTGNNIFMRHLDSLNVADYAPFNTALKGLSSGSSISNPAVLTGSSKKFTTMDDYNNLTGITSPVTEILDNYNLGAVIVNTYENTSGMRSYNGKAYLDRNFTIKPENNPNGAATINVRLFFTTAQFNALKAADPLITSPGDLGVIKQPNTTSVVPSEYAPVAGEETISQKGWKAVDGGFYIEIEVTSFSNFFIEQVTSALPVTWLGVNAKWISNGKAAINWQIANEINVKDYTVQISSDGYNFINACTTAAANLTSYHCDAVTGSAGKYYFRVLQRDLDGRSTVSKVVVLQAEKNTAGLTLSPNPAGNYAIIHNENPAASIHSISIITMDGKIARAVNSIAGNSYTISLQSLRAGIYSVRILLSDGTVAIKKLIKQ